MEGPLVWPISQYDPRTQRHLLSKFPYSIVYVVRDGDVTVAAVAHAKRRPGYWRERIG
jgi:toxin ParE1/3/4